MTQLRTELEGERDEKVLEFASPAELSQDPPTQTSARLPQSRLVIFAVGQSVLWAAHSAGILETSFILPYIQLDFRITEADVQWVLASYMLGCAQLLAGRLCDVLGKKRGYLFGCSTYILWNIVATFMPNLASLNVCRALTGISSAFLLPSSLALTGDLFPSGRARTFAFVVITCGSAAGASSGQLFAGLFIERTPWGWRPCFLTTGLPCLIPLLITWRLVPADPPVSKNWKVDLTGAFAIGSALLLLLLTLTLAQNLERGWSTPYLPGLLVGSALCFVLFGWRQWYLTRAASQPGNQWCPPLIPTGLISWKKRNLTVIYIGAFFCWASTDSFFVYVSYLYKEVLRKDPYETGLKLSATFFSGITASIATAVTISRVPPRVLMAGFVLFSSISDTLFAVRKLDWKYWQGDLWSFLVRWYGTDAIAAAGNTYISQTASPEDLSMGAALLQMCCRLGNAVGLAISMALRDYARKKADQDGMPKVEAILKGLHAAFWSLTAFSFFSAVVIAFGMKGWEYLDTAKDQRDGSMRSDQEAVRSPQT